VLLAVPGASAYFMGGACGLHAPAGEAFLTATPSKRKGIRSSSEPWATLAAELVRERLNTTWGLAETGASGPTGNSYGDPAGHTVRRRRRPQGQDRAHPCAPARTTASPTCAPSRPKR
jgi:nicotinamide mononucleotide (NMN) deamidase PncC